MNYKNKTKAELLDEIKKLKDEIDEHSATRGRLSAELLEKEQHLKYARRVVETQGHTIKDLRRWQDIATSRIDYNIDLYSVTQAALFNIIKMCPVPVLICPKCGAVEKVNDSWIAEFEKRGKRAVWRLCADCLPDEPDQISVWTWEDDKGNKNEVKCNFHVAYVDEPPKGRDND